MADNVFKIVPVDLGAQAKEEFKEEVADELGDLGGSGGIECRRIKMPTGKAKAFEVEGDNPDDPQLLKEVRGVVLFTHRMNARWEGDYTGDNSVPVCTSWDGEHGTDFATGEVINCNTCLRNIFREGTKECKNTRRIYMLMDNEPHLYMLSIPPTSLTAVTSQLKKIVKKGTPLTRAVVVFRLEAARSRTNRDYAKVTVEKVCDLPKEQGDLARKMRLEIKAQYEDIAEDGGMVAAEPEDGGFTDAPEGTVPQFDS